MSLTCRRPGIDPDRWEAGTHVRGVSAEALLASDVTSGRRDDLRAATASIAAAQGAGIEDVVIGNDRPVGVAAFPAYSARAALAWGLAPTDGRPGLRADFGVKRNEVPIKPDAMPYVYGMNGPPEVIYIIRHAEKPLKPPSSGVDFEGGQNEHSLLPRGWQRSGALAALFHPGFGPIRAGLLTPTVLVAPSWGHPGKTAAHRSYQTIQCLSEQLGLPIASEFVQGQEQQLASSLVRSCSGVVLICWEHSHIPTIASSLPVLSRTAIPRKWPGDRYDVIWSFTLVPGPGPARYTFGQIPQQLLPGDTGTVIPAEADEANVSTAATERPRGSLNG